VRKREKRDKKKKRGGLRKGTGGDGDGKKTRGKEEESKMVNERSDV
jgi:hypothetical protein